MDCNKAVGERLSWTASMDAVDDASPWLEARSVLNFLKTREVGKLHQMRRSIVPEELVAAEDLIKQVIERGFMLSEVRGTEPIPSPHHDSFFPIQALCNILMNPFVIANEELRIQVLHRGLNTPHCGSMDSPDYAIKLSACVGCQTKDFGSVTKKLLRNIIETESSHTVLSTRATIAYAAKYLTKCDEDLKDACSLLFHPQYFVRENIQAWIFRQFFREALAMSNSDWVEIVIKKLLGYVENTEKVNLHTVLERFVSSLQKFRNDKQGIGFSSMNQFTMVNIPNLDALHVLELWKHSVVRNFDKVADNHRLASASFFISQYGVSIPVFKLFDLNGDGKLSENEALQLSYMWKK